MYDELVKRLNAYSAEHEYHGGITAEAADAIAELQQTVEHYKGCADDWYRDACDYKAICEQMKATIIVEAQHTEMFDERDRKTLMEMAKSLPLQIIPYKDEKPRWISVTERLPEPYVDVIATDGDFVGIASYQKKGMYWLSDDLFDDTHIEITHWMPLPDPPKEE